MVDRIRIRQRPSGSLLAVIPSLHEGKTARGCVLTSLNPPGASASSWRCKFRPNLRIVEQPAEIEQRTPSRLSLGHNSEYSESSRRLARRSCHRLRDGALTPAAPLPRFHTNTFLFRRGPPARRIPASPAGRCHFRPPANAGAVHFGPFRVPAATPPGTQNAARDHVFRQLLS